MNKDDHSFSEEAVLERGGLLFVRPLHWRASRLHGIKSRLWRGGGGNGGGGCTLSFGESGGQTMGGGGLAGGGEIGSRSGDGGFEAFGFGLGFGGGPRPINSILRKKQT